MDLATARRQVRRRKRATKTRDRDAFALGGGLNLVDPPMTIKPGYALAAENYEIGINGGYERLGGFERFSGADAPSDETYHVIGFRHSAPFTIDLAVGEVVAGDATGAATIIEAVELAAWGRCYCAYADQLGNAAWTPSGASVDLAPGLDPPDNPGYGVDMNGASDSATAWDSRDVVPRDWWKLTEDGTTAVHEIRNSWIANVANPVANLGDQLIVSVFAHKTSSRRYLRLYPSVSAFLGSVVPVAVFDLVTGTVVSQSATVHEAYVEDRDYGHGVRRCVMITDPLTSNQNAFDAVVGLVNDSQASSYTGASGYAYVTGLNTDKRSGAAPNLAGFARTLQVSDLPVDAGVAYLAVHSVTAFTHASGSQGDLEDSSAVRVGIWSGAEQERSAPNVDKHQEYLDHVAAIQRALIIPVPGDGRIRGVWMYAGRVFALRDDTSGSPDVCKMYRSTTGGWSEVTFDPHLDFDAGLAAGETLLVENATVTGATSGATGVVERINVTNSGWGLSSAVGTLVLSGVTGTFQNNETLRVGGTPVATEDGILYTPTWTNGGRYRFRTHNFYGATNTRRMYGVNGLNRYFEYDDTDGILASYRTGMTVDTPEWIAIDQNQLMLGFPGGSWQIAGVGFPAEWTVVLGAAEIGLGDDITGCLEETAGSLFIFTRGRTHQLTGNPLDGYKLDSFDFENGAIADSVQKIGMGIHLDDRGFGSLTSSDRHGNYQANTFSRLIQPLVSQLLKTTTVTESVIHRGGNRYRCFFADGRFISIGVNGNKITGHMACSYGGKVVRCAVSAEDAAGAERIFFGSDDGYIYEAEKGTSFDGDAITAALRPAFHHSGNPDRVKRYRTGRIEAVANGPCSLYVTTDLSFGDTIQAERDVSAAIGGAIWSYLADYETFNYNARIEPLKSFRIEADGTHIGLWIRHVSNVERQHTLRAVVYQSSLRGLKRGAQA